jgi:hypothetical protein
MGMNSKMSEMLRAANITTPFAHSGSLGTLTPHSFTVVEGSLLLKDEYEKAKHVKLGDFPDRTGFECFVNHVHLPYDGSRESLQSCLCYVTALQKGLTQFGEGRPFLVILSVSDGDCVVRFHQRRPPESWLADDLEGYAEEAILVLPVEGPRSVQNVGRPGGLRS